MNIASWNYNFFLAIIGQVKPLRGVACTNSAVPALHAVPPSTCATRRVAPQVHPCFTRRHARHERDSVVDEMNLSSICQPPLTSRPA